jgi:sodium-dependent phosphate transporter
VSPILSGIIAVLLYTAIRYLVLQASEPIARGLICMPLFYGITIAINIFTVVHDGSQRKWVMVYAITVFYVMTVGIILTFGSLKYM